MEVENGNGHSNGAGAGAGAGGGGDTIDEGLYSRQLYVMGHEAQRRLGGSSVLICGLRGVGVEVAKNVILAGVKSVTLHDPEPACVGDLSAQFYLSEASVGTPRAQACVGQLAELNQYVKVAAHDGALSDAFVQQFQVVVMVGASLAERLRVNDACRASGARFIACDARGLFAHCFCDFGDAFVVHDTNGEPAAVRMLSSISRANPGLVTVSDAGVESPLEGRELRPGWWLCRNRTNDAFALLAALWRRGVTPRVSRVAFERGALRFAPGTLAFELPLGEAGAALVAELETLAERRRVELVPSEAPPTGPADRLESVRIGLYQPWTASMDEGWTRLVLERFELPYVSLHNADIRAGAEQLRARVDVVLLPSMRSSRMLDGVARDATAPRYAGGLGVEGVAALQGFAEQGGVLVANDASCDLLIKHLRLPVKNVLRADEAKDFYCAGSILRATVDVRHPLGYGMPERCAAFFTRSQAFEVEEQAWPRPVAAAKKKNVEPAALPPGMRPERARRYPSVAPVRYAESLLLESGWIQQPEHIEGKPAIVESRYGRGRVILLGFRVQHRAQPHGTFRLLFNALVRGGLRPLDE